MYYCGIDNEKCRRYKNGKCADYCDCEHLIEEDPLAGIEHTELAQIVLAHSASIKKRLDDQAKTLAQIQQMLAGIQKSENHR